jgi:hypothetical protein
VKLLRLGDLGPRADTKVFRASVLGRVIGLVVTLGVPFGVTASYVWGGAPLWALAVGGVISVLILRLSLMTLGRALSSANWVMMIGNDGVWVKFTSFMKSHLLQDEFQAVFIPFAELKSARVMGRARKEGSVGPPRVSYVTFLELFLQPSEASDLDELSRAIDASRKVRAGGMMQLAPVTFGDNVLRIRWSGRNAMVTPRIDRAVRELGEHVQVEDEEG